MHRVARQVIEVAGRRSHRLAVNLEVYLAVENVIGLVPIMPMRWRAHAKRNVLFEQRPGSAGLFGFAKHAEWHTENIEGGSFSGLHDRSGHEQPPSRAESPPRRMPSSDQVRKS